MSAERSLSIDTNLQLRVQVALAQCAEARLANPRDRIVVSANRRGQVTLRGRVEDQKWSNAASQVAQSVPGVNLVFNQVSAARDSRPLALRR